MPKNPSRARRRIRMRRLDTSLFDSLMYLTTSKIRMDEKLKTINKRGDWILFKQKLQQICDDDKFWNDVRELLVAADKLKFQIGY